LSGVIATLHLFLSARTASTRVHPFAAGRGRARDQAGAGEEYLLGAGLPLWDIAHRPPEAPEHYATVTVSRHDATRPVYVLTSSQTFSGGEGLAFILQERHRAEIVGEVTAGAANAGRPYRINARFSVTIPNGQVKSAVSGGNWEGAG
jgi:retinol-binding protein 3